MAQLKDLIVNGPTRLIGPAYGKISSADTVPVINSNANLAFNASTKIATVGGVDITAKLPAGGYQGPQGPNGTNGTHGKQGPQGPKGTDGTHGKQGPQGPKGTDGTNGTHGKQGPQGPKGTDGTNGTHGKQGPQGPKGTDGTNGTHGKQGPQGPKGTDGTHGKQGPQGPKGTDGTNGTHGKQGPQGPAGTNGTHGTDGKQGPQGPIGQDGYYIKQSAQLANKQISVWTGTTGSYSGVGKTVIQTFTSGHGLRVNDYFTLYGTDTAGNGHLNIVKVTATSDTKVTGTTVSAVMANKGTNGSPGSKGDDGNQGPQGPTGGTGGNGANGKQGPQGPKGGTGGNGTDGKQGPQGPAGSTGGNGTNGKQGPQGPIGIPNERLAETDTRGTNQIPNWYMTNYGKSIITEFKTISTIGVSSILTGTYCNLTTITPWGDSSGGLPVQIATNNTSTGKFAYRTSNSAGTGWNAWQVMGAQGPQGPVGPNVTPATGNTKSYLLGDTGLTASLTSSSVKTHANIYMESGNFVAGGNMSVTGNINLTGDFYQNANQGLYSNHIYSSSEGTNGAGTGCVGTGERPFSIIGAKEWNYKPRTNDNWYVGFGAGNGNLAEFNFIHVTGSTSQRMLTITSAETIELNYHRLQNVGTPTGANDAANKGYVDSVVTGTYIITEDELTMTQEGKTGDEVYFAPGTYPNARNLFVFNAYTGDTGTGNELNICFRKLDYNATDSNGYIYFMDVNVNELVSVPLPSAGGGGSTSLSLTTSNNGNHYLIGCNSTATTSVALSSSNTHRAGAGTGAGIYWSGWELYASSDERLKDFYGDIDVDFDKIKSLPKKYFKWKNEEIDGSKMNIGTSAQKLKEIYPELVSNGDDGTLGVCYEKLSIVALAAVDKLHEENEELKKKYEDLENRLKELEKLLLK